jgi:hypothetical protein
LASQDTDFGFEPRALAPDLKSLDGKVHIERKKRDRKKLDRSEWGIQGLKVKVKIFASAVTQDYSI